MNIIDYIKKPFLRKNMEKKAKIPLSIQTFGGSGEGLSIQGASHIKHGKICQDFGGHYRCDEYAVAVVCDGHGSDPYFRSDRGSKFAVVVTINAVKAFMTSKKEFLDHLFASDNADIQKEYASKVIEQLIRSIISSWNDRVLEDMRENPFTEEELSGLSDKYKVRYSSEDDNKKFAVYGTTLIATVRAPEFWFAIRNGDGRCVAVFEDGEMKDPIPWNDKCFLNATTSLCDDEAFENFRQCFQTNSFPVAIYVATDGIDDSFGGLGERLFSFYKTVTTIFAEEGFEKGKQDLAAYLPKLTEKGSGDDISVSGIIDMKAIKNLAFLHEEEKEDENTVENEEEKSENTAEQEGENTTAEEENNNEKGNDKIEEDIIQNETENNEILNNNSTPEDIQQI